MGVSSSLAEGSALAGRAYFLLCGQKKVAKEKATPGSAPGCARSPALLAVGGGCGTRGYAPQTVLALFPPTAALLGTSQGARKTRRSATIVPASGTSGRARMAFGVPLEGAEQRRQAGGLRLALSEPQASLASRPACRVAQGTGRSPAPTWGSPFLCLLSFGEAKESETPRKGGTHRQRRNNTNPQSGQIKT
jgi:hypothetical protein